MKYLTLIVVVWLLVGCAEPDPMRAAIAQERANNAAVAANSSAAQISQAQQADADARRAQENLQALQERNAIVQGQSIIASSSMVSGIVASNNQTMLVLADKMIEASRPDYTPLYVLFGVLAVVVVIVVVIIARMNVAMAQAVAQPHWRALPPPNRRPIALDAIPHQVALAAQQRGGFPQHDGERWIIVDATGRRLATQRKQLAG